MITASPNSSAFSPAALALLADYERWLHFVTTSRRTIRQCDRQLAQIAAIHVDLREWVGYLRGCLHQRTQFFGSLAIILTGKVAQLRTEPTNTDLICRLTNAQPMMRLLVAQLAEAFADVEASYRTLPVA